MYKCDFCGKTSNGFGIFGRLVVAGIGFFIFIVSANSDSGFGALIGIAVFVYAFIQGRKFARCPKCGVVVCHGHGKPDSKCVRCGNGNLLNIGRAV